MDDAPSWSRRRRYREDDDFATRNPRAEFEEVFDESMSLSHWFDVGGHRQPFQSLELEEAENLSHFPTDKRAFHPPGIVESCDQCRVLQGSKFVAILWHFISREYTKPCATESCLIGATQ